MIHTIKINSSFYKKKIINYSISLLFFKINNFINVQFYPLSMYGYNSPKKSCDDGNSRELSQLQDNAKKIKKNVENREHKDL